MPNRIACLLTASALALSASAAFAQSAPDPSVTAASAAPANRVAVAPLTVQGVAPPAMVEHETYNFVQKFAAAPNPELDQIARWRDPVCVEVLGLPAEQNALIKARIEGVAASLGLPKAREACAADVEILFTGRPQAMMDAVAQRREELLGYYHRHDGGHLKTVDRPIQAWYVTATRGSSASPTDFPWNLEIRDDPVNWQPTGCGQSHIFTVCLQSVLKNVLVVADSKALEGKDAGMVADYLAMLTLAQPKSLEGCNDLASVIDAFATTACAGRDVPDGLTPGDAAYLTALYQADPEATKWNEQGDIARRMAKILINAKAGG
jgi:hypothetical protein